MLLAASATVRPASTAERIIGSARNRSIIPLAIAVCWIAVAARGRNRHGLIAMLTLAGTVQACDVVIGLVTGTPSMVAGAATATAIHLGSAVLIRRR